MSIATQVRTWSGSDRLEFRQAAYKIANSSMNAHCFFDGDAHHLHFKCWDGSLTAREQVVLSGWFNDASVSMEVRQVRIANMLSFIKHQRVAMTSLENVFQN